MKLSELFLNRYLYRDNEQDSSTKDASFLSADSSESDPVSIPSGGAALDINTGNVQIDGAQLEPGTYPQTTLDVSNWGWGQTCAFTSADLNTVTWGAGTFTSADGTSYAISAGTTGVMAAKTYIYLSLFDSETEYQITTTSSTAVGLGKVLIAVAENAADSATYNLSEATQIVGDNIIANTIDASKITTGSLVVGTNVLIGSAFASVDAGDLAELDKVGTSQIDTTVISGGKIVTGLLTATNIQTGTLSAILIQTSTSANVGIKMSSAIGGMDVYGETIDLYYGATLYGSFGTTNGYFGMSSASNRNIKIKTDAGTTYFDVSAGAGIAPLTGGTGDCGLSTQYWANVYTNNLQLSSGKYLNVVSARITASSDLVATGSLHATGNVYTGGVSGTSGSLNAQLLLLADTETSPTSAGEIRNYASGATDQFRGVPGNGTWVGSFDMTAI